MKKKDKEINYFYFGAQYYWKLVEICIMEITVGVFLLKVFLSCGVKI